MSTQTEENSSKDTDEFKNSDYNLWIHCNICYEQYVKKNHSFILLSCNHIFCETCLSKMKVQLAETPGGQEKYKCGKCLKTVRGRQIGNGMPPHLKQLFHPRPFEEGLPMAKILSFQCVHRQHLIDGFLKLQDKAQALEEKCKLQKETLKNVYEDFDKCQKEAKSLQRRVRRIIEFRNSEKSQNDSDIQDILDIGQSTSDESSTLFVPTTYKKSIGEQSSSSEVTSFTRNNNYSFVL